MRIPSDPLVRDSALAVLLTVVGQVELVAARDQVEGPLLVQHLAFALMTAPVAIRRRWPLVAVLVCSVGVVIQTAAGDAPVASGFLAMLTLLASLGYHGSRRDGLLGVGALLLANASYELLGNEVVVGDIVVNVLILVGVWFLAHRVRVHSDARVEAELMRDRVARDAAAAERTRISRDLHDSVAHALTAMTLQAGAAREQADGAVAEALEAIGEAGRFAMSDMHRFLRLLGPEGGGPESPGLLDLGEVTTNARRAGLDVQVETSGDVTSLPASVSATCYRVVQEALTNTLKHSDARQARVEVAVNGGGVRVEVSDDGRGAARLPGGSGRGLSGLRERVDLFGGRLEAEPAPAGGWQVSAWLPTASQGA